MRVAETSFGSQGTGSTVQPLLQRHSAKVLRSATRILYLFFSVFCCIYFQRAAYAEDLENVVAGLQRQYASVKTLTGNFRQTYRAPGIDQVESGVFWLKKPGLMRWEYRSPEEKLFVADGRESFLYVPQDRQVTVQPLTLSDLHSTPLQFLLGEGNIHKSFLVSWEADSDPKANNSYLIRLTPSKSEPGYSYLVLEIDRKTWDLQSILIREPSGNTSEFLFTNLIKNIKIENGRFRFKPPKGVELIRLAE
jgi:outer membrane lipoprotein carrier protein